MWPNATGRVGPPRGGRTPRPAAKRRASWWPCMCSTTWPARPCTRCRRTPRRSIRAGTAIPRTSRRSPPPLPATGNCRPARYVARIERVRQRLRRAPAPWVGERGWCGIHMQAGWPRARAAVGLGEADRQIMGTPPSTATAGGHGASAQDVRPRPPPYPRPAAWGPGTSVPWLGDLAASLAPRRQVRGDRGRVRRHPPPGVHRLGDAVARGACRRRRHPTPKRASGALRTEDAAAARSLLALALSRQTPPRNVVCVHGLTRNGRDFDAVAARLVKAGAYRVFCIDLIGRGRSDYLKPESAAGYDYPLYVDHLKQFVVRRRALEPPPAPPRAEPKIWMVDPGWRALAGAPGPRDGGRVEPRRHPRPHVQRGRPRRDPAPRPQRHWHRH